MCANVHILVGFLVKPHTLSRTTRHFLIYWKTPESWHYNSQQHKKPVCKRFRLVLCGFTFVLCGFRLVVRGVSCLISRNTTWNTKTTRKPNTTRKHINSRNSTRGVGLSRILGLSRVVALFGVCWKSGAFWWRNPTTRETRRVELCVSRVIGLLDQKLDPTTRNSTQQFGKIDSRLVLLRNTTQPLEYPGVVGLSCVGILEFCNRGVLEFSDGKAQQLEKLDSSCCATRSGGAIPL